MGRSCASRIACRIVSSENTTKLKSTPTRQDKQSGTSQLALLGLPVLTASNTSLGETNTLVRREASESDPGGDSSLDGCEGRSGISKLLRLALNQINRSGQSELKLFQDTVMVLVFMTTQFQDSVGKPFQIVKAEQWLRAQLEPYF